MEKELLTTMEVAEKLGVTRWRINAMIRDDRLPAERFGGIWLVRAKDLAAVMVRKNGRPKKVVEPAAPPKEVEPVAPQPKKPEPQTLLSIEAAAVKLKCSQAEIRKMLRNGLPTFQSDGRRRMIGEKSLLKFRQTLNSKRRPKNP